MAATKENCSTSISKTKGLEHKFFLSWQVFRKTKRSPFVVLLSRKNADLLHVGHKLIKANQCLFILRSLRKEGYTKAELDHLFQSRSRSTMLLMQVYIKPYIL